MNKAELVNVLAEKQGITKVAAAANVDAFLEAVSGALNAGDHVQLIGFGSFQVVKSSARKGRNPRTGEAIKIPASSKVRFNTSSVLRAKLNAPKKAKRK